jgi:exodeoxyribonuclease-3
MQNYSVFALNPNGIRAYLKKAKADLQRVLKEHQPDVLFFIETKMNAKEDIVKDVETQLDKAFGEVFNGVDLPKREYNYHWSHCERPGRHGTCAAIRKDIPVTTIRYNIDHTLPTDTHECEGRTITIELDTSVFVGLYVVNASQQLKRLEYKQEWNTQLYNYLNHLRENSNKAVWVLGDLNVALNEVDIANPDSNKRVAGFTNEERKQFREFLETGWIYVWRDKHPVENEKKSMGNKGVYTYWNTKSRARDRNAGWRIDYVLCDSTTYSTLEKDKVVSYILGDVMGSDHCPVGVKFSAK